jgi:phosphoenolpyruvate carboxykinase (GTP)
MAIKNAKQYLQEKLDKDNFSKLSAIANDKLYQFIADSFELTKPAKVFVSTDKPEDVEYTRKQSIATGEEKPLKTQGHTIHFDGMEDQGRDREVTKYLVPDRKSTRLNSSHIR